MIFENDIFSQSSDIPLLKKKHAKVDLSLKLTEHLPGVWPDVGGDQRKSGYIFGVSIAHRQKKIPVLVASF